MKNPDESDNQQVQVASQIDSENKENLEKKAHKGIYERFNDKINEDVQD